MKRSTDGAMDLESQPQLAAAIIERNFDGAQLQRVTRLTGGVSADVYRLYLRRASGEAASVVLRVHGASHSGHAASLEFTLLRALSEAGVPVAEPLALDTSGEIIGYPYLIMAFVDGSTSRPSGDESGYFARMASALAGVHRTPLDALPALPRRVDPVPELLDFLPEDDRWDKLRRRLATMSGTTYEDIPRLLHGDFWPENLLWHGGELAAILDWEDAAIGDPLSDVACCRLELRYRYGRSGMSAFTKAFEAHASLDDKRLALWQIYVAAAAHKYMGDWGLPSEKEAHMHRVALVTMEESASVLLAP